MPKAEIANKQALYALEQLHAELAGKLKESKKETARIAADMKKVEAVMKLFDPDYSLRGIAVRRRRKNPWFKRGTLFRAAVDAMRDAQGPLTTRQIAERMLQAKGIPNPSEDDLRDLSNSVQASLRFQKDKKVQIVDRGPPVCWSL